METWQQYFLNRIQENKDQIKQLTQTKEGLILQSILGKERVNFLVNHWKSVIKDMENDLNSFVGENDA